MYPDSRSGEISTWYLWAATLVLAILCSCSAQTDGPEISQDALDEDDFRGCPEINTRFGPGLQTTGDHFAIRLVSATPSEPERYLNSWIVEIEALDGATSTDAEIERSQTFMAIHGHDGRVVPEIIQTEEPDEYRIERINFSMRGPWEVRFWVRSPASGEDYLVFNVCVTK